MEFANFKGEIRLKEPMSRHTSFKIGGPADIFAIPADRQDLASLLRELTSKGIPYFILGGGTNLLVKDSGIRGVVVSMERLNSIEIERTYRSIGGTFSVIRAEAGAALPRLLAFSVDRSLTGLEFAAGIPGTVGGAICMNAGTAKGEIGDVIDSVTLLSPNGEVVIRSREEMEFGYRTSNIPKGHIVVEARLILRLENKDKVRVRIQEIMDNRKKVQPYGLPNAGSIFKNPHDESAGSLIDKAGLKGLTIGGASVSERHANFIVNTGNASAKDVIQLMQEVQKRVLEIHGVSLDPEVKIIGED